jgi:hypothetical protein
MPVFVLREKCWMKEAETNLINFNVVQNIFVLQQEIFFFPFPFKEG